jgi:hypothetical protein
MYQILLNSLYFKIALVGIFNFINDTFLKLDYNEICTKINEKSFLEKSDFLEKLKFLEKFPLPYSKN